MASRFVKKIVVKVGSNVITRADGLPDEERMAQLVAQIAQLNKQNIGVVLVSSGAVASGRSVITIKDKTDTVAARQQLAAVGQIKLINTYSTLFAKQDIVCAQVLVTKGDFRDRRHYLNMKSCVNNLLENYIVPVVNENDVIAVTELMFTDNDELSALIASMIGADALVLLTSVDGLYNGNPTDPASQLIPLIDKAKVDFSFISNERSNFGRGGMITKARMAHKLAKVGVAVHIANGKKDNILLDVLGGKAVGTTFTPHKSASQLKRWVANTEGFAHGAVYVNQGAHDALINTGKAISLLPVGITKIDGLFEKGDVVRILTEKGEPIGMGVAKYSSTKALERLGQKGQPPLVHYDYLYLNDV
jgi:glutamate 5-kinase